MRFTFFTLAAIAGMASAQLNLPTCATTCATDFTRGGTIAGCQLADVRCICQSGGFLADIACCLASRCTADEQARAASEAATFCRNVAAVTGLPTAVVCSSTVSATPSATPSSAPSGSSVTSSTTTTGTAVLSSGSAAVSSTVSAATRSASPTTAANAASHYGPGMGAGVLGAIAAILL